LTKRLLIIGAGGHGKVAADCAELTEQFDEIAFLDSRYPSVENVGGWPVVGDGKNVSEFAEACTYFFVAIGDNKTRAKIMTPLLESSRKLATLIHPSAVVSQYVKLGEGTLVCANAVINVATNIGRGCIINTAASIDHDCQIEDYVHIAPGTRLAGSINVGECTFLGIGSAVIPGKTLGKYSTLGAGSTLIGDLPSHSVAVGTPAKVIKK
jgi:sugar O-acyltransferase (sialic acid O-acetyltransferase NeuD family)